MAVVTGSALALVATAALVVVTTVAWPAQLAQAADAVVVGGGDECWASEEW